MTTPSEPSAGRPASQPPAREEVWFELALFVSGASDLSARAIAQARELCDAHLGDRYRLSILDVHDDQAAALSHGVIVAPTLVKIRPAPARQYVGDLSPAGRVLLALELPERADRPASPSGTANAPTRP